MCNLYSQTKGQRAMIALTKSMRDSVGNLPPPARHLPGLLGPDRAHQHRRRAQTDARQMGHALAGLRPGR